MADEVLTSRDGAVLTITLNRPDVYNAINRAMHEGLAAALAEAADPEIRAVVLTGAGRGFCSGQDLREFQSLPGGVREALEQTYHPNIRAIRALEKPVIAAINGPVRRRRPLARLRVRRPHRLVRRELRARLHRDRPRTRRRRHVVHPSPARLHARLRVDGLEPPTERPTRRSTGASSRSRSPADEFHARVAELASWYAALPTRAVAMTKQLFEHAYTASLEEQLALEARAPAGGDGDGRLRRGRRGVPREAPARLQGRVGNRRRAANEAAYQHRHGNSLSGGTRLPGR